MKTPSSTKTRGKRGNTAAASPAPAGTAAPARTKRSYNRSTPNGGTPAQAEATPTTIATPASKARVATMKRSIAISRKMGEALSKQLEQNTTLLEMLEAERKQLEAA